MQRRYNDFLTLHHALVRSWLSTNPYLQAGRGALLPYSFPVPKLMMHTSESLAERFKALQLYLFGLLALLEASRVEGTQLDAAVLVEFLGAQPSELSEDVRCCCCGQTCCCCCCLRSRAQRLARIPQPENDGPTER